jgi:hypothetical protein
VKVEVLQDRLFALSGELAAGIGSAFPLLADMLVPVSMALLTEYTPEYLGVPGEDAPAGEAPARGAAAPAAPLPGAMPKDCGTCGEAPGAAAGADCGGSVSWVLGGEDADAEPDGSGKGR